MWAPERHKAHHRHESRRGDTFQDDDLDTAMLLAILELEAAADKNHSRRGSRSSATPRHKSHSRRHGHSHDHGHGSTHSSRKTVSRPVIFSDDPSNKYFKLSNLYSTPVVVDGVNYACCEVYYQSQKVAGTRIEAKVADCLTGQEARDITRKSRYKRYIRPDWWQIRVKKNIMRRALRAKYSQHKRVTTALLETGDRPLVYRARGNPCWGDDGPGGKGSNYLGQLLVEIRDEIRRGELVYRPATARRVTGHGHSAGHGAGHGAGAGGGDTLDDDSDALSTSAVLNHDFGFEQAELDELYAAVCATPPLPPPAPHVAVPPPPLPAAEPKKHKKKKKTSTQAPPAPAGIGLACPPCPDGDDCEYLVSAISHRYSEKASFHFKAYTHAGYPAPCRYGADCNKFQRLCAGGARIADMCHVSLFEHGARVSHEPESAHVEFSLGATTTIPEPKVRTLTWDRRKHRVKKELFRNGLGSAWTLPEGSEYATLGHLVTSLRASKRHTTLGSPLKDDEMLAIVLYTGTQVYHELRACERAGDYSTWKHTSSALESALHYLGRAQAARYTPANACQFGCKNRAGAPTCAHGEQRTRRPIFKLYRGLQSRHLPVVKSSKDDKFHFDESKTPTTKFASARRGFMSLAGVKVLQTPTFSSFTWDPQQATRFARGQGTVLELDDEADAGGTGKGGGMFCGVNAADVSWISKFPGECEILFGRGLPLTLHESDAERGAKKVRYSPDGRLQFVSLGVAHVKRGATVPGVLHRVASALKKTGSGT